MKGSDTMRLIEQERPLAVLALGLIFRWDGLLTGGLALNLASFAEVIYLGLQTNKIVTWDLSISDFIPQLATPNPKSKI